MLEFTPIDYMILLIDIMVVSGALGGMVSALLSWREDQSFLGVLFKHTLTGIVMAMTVPLILNMFSSDLLDAAQVKPLRLFILGGLCICVALFSAIVLERIYGSQLKREEQQYQQVCQTKVQQTEEQQTAEQKIEERPVRKEESVDTAIPVPGSEKVKASDDQLKILQALAGVENAKLTLADLLRYTRMPQKDFDETLSLLLAKGSIAQELSGAKKLQMVLTARGRQQLDKMSGK
ncbi:MAG TPA: YEATS-associated helix-containing protein [Syntrophales bacterium]|nr:YEATS-associated helix-containing protein [Syntrophales bacterium]